MALRFQGFNGRQRLMHGFRVSDGGHLDICEVELRNLHRGERSSFDSHVHTTASDGERTPQRLAKEAYLGGFSVVVTDHYSLKGATSAMDEHALLAEETADEVSSGIVAGIEISVRVDLPGARQIRKLHILGVGLDTGNKRLIEWLADYRSLRGLDIDYALDVKADLEDEGFRFHDNIVQRLSYKRNVYQVLVESMFAKNENHRLIERRFGMRIRAQASRHKRRRYNIKMRRKLVNSLRQEYGDFTASKPRLDEVLGLIKGAGGLAIVAHPVSSVPQMPHFSLRKMTEIFMELEAEGVDGIEAYTPKHRLEVADAIAKAAFDAGLIVSGGSDAHRLDHDIGELTRPVSSWC